MKMKVYILFGVDYLDGDVVYKDLINVYSNPKAAENARDRIKGLSPDLYTSFLINEYGVMDK